MDTQLSIDLGQIAHELHLSLSSVQHTVELLDEGNTVPFITRYRRERTGGLDEEQIRLIAEEVGTRRQLLERKKTILKTIESQGKLTPELQHDIEQAPNLKRLEDLYLPFKVKKQTLATKAREQGLEPLALEILNGEFPDLEARAATFVNPEKELPSTAEVLAGVQHLIAERISERADVRGRLRRIFFRTGRLICTKIEKPPEPVAEPLPPEAEPVAVDTVTSESLPDSQAGIATEAVTPEPAVAESAAIETAAAVEPTPEASEAVEATASGETAVPTEGETAAVSETVSNDLLPKGRMFEKPATPISVSLEKKKKKKKKNKLTENAFKDYFNFQEPLAKLPPHRTLAINRGERANVLRVKIEADVDAMLREAEVAVIPPQHPHGQFLWNCTKDALTRLLIPSLEREARREFSEKAELHAVEVFVRNLRKLLLQAPVHGRRVLAIDPGFKSGCKMAAVDEWGNVLAHGMFFIVGKDERKEKARARIAELVRQHKLSVIAIGNGTASRESEQLVADMLANELKDLDVAYVTVNEAGASVYSTSPLGREELPGFDAILRSAVSIARRLLDPLSELVKINPANIGVGLYQHDMKAKHLKESLDAVVESCVNFVGVDVNTASPALLRYVSGLNALTARRIYEYRREHGPFQNREALKKVPGVGEASFVQAAGFLKVLGGDNPLDATWIHPESYEVAKKLLERFGSSVEELKQAVPEPLAPPPPPEAPKFGEGLLPETIATEPTTTAESIPSSPVAEATSAPEVVDEPLAQAEQGGIQTEEAIVTAALNETASDDAIAEHMPPHYSAPAADATSTEPVAPPAPKVNPIAEKLAQVDVAAVAQELSVSPMLVEDLVVSLTRPGRDPREELQPPVFRRGIMKLDDLSAGMELQGTVLNVVDFGAFVDIGLSDSGLVHISRLADRYIRDPHEVVGIGDVLKLWVVDVDRNRRRVSLTAIQPGTERPVRPPVKREESREARPPRPPRNRPQQQGPPPANAGGPPPAARAGGGNRSGPPAQQPSRPPRERRPQGGPPKKDFGPRVVERPSSKPKVVKPITKAQEEGKAPLRSFSDLMQLIEKKKDKP